MKTLRVFFLFYFLIIQANCQSLKKVKTIVINPKEFNIKGSVVKALSWNDSLGKNILIACQSSPYDEKGDGNKESIDVYGYHFLSDKKGKSELWAIVDTESGCFKDWDLLAKFFIDAIQVTDLDNNGVCETWLIYKLLCTTDIRPAKMKIIMHEGASQYVISGHSRVPYTNNTFLGGDFELDSNFMTALPVFNNYANQLWNKYKDKRWED